MIIISIYKVSEYEGKILVWFNPVLNITFVIAIRYSVNAPIWREWTNVCNTFKS